MATISISQLDTATQAKVDDLYEVAVVDENSQTGYASRKLTAAQIATLFAQGVQFSGLSTATKTIIAAINEAAENGGTEVEANPAGEPTDTLETIGIDGTVYEVGGSKPVSKTATGNPIHIEDAADAPIVSGEVTFEPKQDLHGYGKPWAGGAGKNKLPLVLADIKTANTTGTWSGNAYTVNGVTFTVLTDDAGNITGINANGENTGSGRATLNLCTVQTLNSLLDGNYIFSGCPSDGSESTYRMFLGSSLFNTGNDVNFSTPIAGNNCGISIYQGYNAQNIVFYPMIRLATETDPTFEPYSNECPIEGYTDCELEVTGKNLLQNTATTNTVNGVTYTVNSDGSVVASGTANGTAVLQICSKIPIDVSWGTVTLSGMEDTTNLVWNSVILYDDSDTIVERIVTTGSGQNKYNKTFNLADYPTVTKISVSIKRLIDGAVGGTIYPQLEKGSTATSYEPYQSTPYTIDLDGTRYGGKVDLVSGVMRVDRKYKKGFTRGVIDSSGKLYKIDELSDAVNITTSSGVADLDESNMGIFLGLVAARSSADFCLAHFATSFYVGGMVGKETELDALLPNLEIVYELATPITVQLTPEQIRTLEGTNNISTNMTSMTVEYITQDYQLLVKLIERSVGHHYSTQERVVGTWFDGKPLYEKVVDFGALPNATTKDLNHNIADIDTVFIVGGYAKNTTSGFVQQLNVPVPSNNQAEMQSQWYFGVTATYIRCFTLADRTLYDECKVILQYTKTTD